MTTEATVQKPQTKYPMLEQAMGGASGSGQSQQQQTTTTNTTEEEAARANEQQQAQAAAAASAQAAQSAAEKPKAVSIDDLDDETALELLNKKLGKKFKSLDEAIEATTPKQQKSKEEIEEEKTARKAKAFEHFIATGKVKKEVYDKGIVEQSRPVREMALQLFAQELRAEDPNVKDEEVEEYFRDYYREELPEDDKLRKLRAKEMNQTVTSYLKSNYGFLDTIENEYEAHETLTTRQTNYGKQVKEVYDALPAQLKVSIPNKNAAGADEPVEYAIDIPENILKAARKDFLTPEMFNAYGAGQAEVKPADIESGILENIRGRMFNEIVAKVATDHAAKMVQDREAQLKNIPATGVKQGSALNGGDPSKKTPPTYDMLKAAQKRMGVA